MDNYNYPVGADNSSAPWNQEKNPERLVDVCVSITLSKTVSIKVDDYTIIDKEISEDGSYYEEIDYSSCDLKSAVEKQIILPTKDWIVDDYEVCLE